jgi:hypothetical protein
MNWRRASLLHNAAFWSCENDFRQGSGAIRHDQHHAWLRYAKEAKVKAAKESLPLALSSSGTLMAPLAAWRPLA